MLESVKEHTILMGGLRSLQRLIRCVNRLFVKPLEPNNVVHVMIPSGAAICVFVVISNNTHGEVHKSQGNMTWT